MRPLWVDFPDDPSTFAMEDQFLAGGDLLVRPITNAGETSATVYLPGGAGTHRWFDVEDLHEAPGGTEIVVEAPLNKIPVFQRGGSVVPRKLRVRRSSKLMFHDPYTLTVALDKAGGAAGTLYLDDEHTFNHQRGLYRYRKFSYSAADGIFRGADAGAEGKEYAPKNVVERIVFLGLPSTPSSVSVVSEVGKSLPEPRPLAFAVAPNTGGKGIVIRKPAVRVGYDFEIKLEFA